MLFVRLLIVGESGAGKKSLVQLLLQNSLLHDSENVGSNVERGSSIRIADKKVKTETLSTNELIEKIVANSNRFWAKVQGIVFVYDQTSQISLETLQSALQHIKSHNINTRYSICMRLFANKSDKVQQIPVKLAESCKELAIPSVSTQFVSREKLGRGAILAISEVEKMVQQISDNHRGSPKLRRRTKQSITMSEQAAIDSYHTPARLPKPSLPDIPTATSEQVAQILTADTPKKKRRRSIFDKFGGSIKKKKRRESLLETDGSASDSECSDSEDGSYTHSNNIIITANLEEMEGFFNLDNVMEHILFSVAPSRENFIEKFLLSLNSAVQPTDFIKQLIVRWDTSNMKEVKAQIILRNRIIQILHSWLTLSAENCFEKEQFVLLDTFLENSVMKTEGVSGAEQLQLLWFKKQRKCVSSESGISFSKSVADFSDDLDTLENAQSILSPRAGAQSNGAHVLNAKTTSSTQYIYKNYQPLEVASQMTLIEHNHFRRISISELQNLHWTRDDKEKKSPQLLYFIQCNTIVSNWIQTLILSESDIKERAKIIKWCISVAQKCKELANFNAVMAIIGGLQACPIDRLKITWEEVGLKARKKVDQLFDFMVRENYKEYRNTLKHCSGPCIPFAGMWLSDLQFMEQANTWTKPDEQDKQVSLLNLTKMNMVSKIFQEFVKFQGSNYLLVENKDLQHCLRNLVTIDEELAYNISTEYEPIITEAEKLERKRLALNTSLDLLRCSKFEQLASEIKTPQEMMEVIDKCNKKLRGDDASDKENFCHSDALEIILLKLCSFQLQSLPQTFQRELNSKLNLLFSFCLVGDSSKHQQLLECIKRIQSLSNEQQASLKRLIKCFKIPSNYRELSSQFLATQNEILKIKEQLQILEQSQFAFENENKEHQAHRKCLEYYKKIIELQKRKEMLVQSKDDRKLKILYQFNELHQQLNEFFQNIASSSNPTECSEELMNISKQLKQSEAHYIVEKKKYTTEHQRITSEKQALQQERQRLLELLAKVDKKIAQTDQAQMSLESTWQGYQHKFSTSKQSFVEKTDDLMKLLDHTEDRNKTTSSIQTFMQEFQQFFSSVLSLENASDVSTSNNQVPNTKQQMEEKFITTRETKRFLQYLLQYLKQFEASVSKLKDSVRRNNETLDAINKMQLNPEVLNREFPQYNELNERAKNFKKEALRLRKSFNLLTKQQLWDTQLLDGQLDEASRCQNSFNNITATLCELLAE